MAYLRYDFMVKLVLTQIKVIKNKYFYSCLVIFGGKAILMKWHPCTIIVA